MTEESLFHEALARPPQERAAFLETACAGQPALRAAVEALLAAQDQPGSLLDRPAVDGATSDAVSGHGIDPAQPPRLTEGPGSRIGPYKLLQQLGEGGMGAVYMAEQEEPVRRRVALKIIKPGMDSRQVIARFEAERQALALMDHPNIARVLDAGTTEAGRPYFVMELVKGVPITRFCDEQHLTPRERLELFVPVCQAIQHAHQKGVIHRDIKPSNVLVASYDGRPVPKVIDFGVAKAAGQPLTERTLVTGLGAVVGTLEYMSPEQAQLNALDIDTRSDVYALGVLLYELLTGSTPLERRRLKEAALLEVLRLIREEEPPRPSTRLSTTDELPSVAANRGLEPKKLSGLVRGELDWIVMKALEKDRNRRYESANGLARDVERYLADEPVHACPPSAWYRSRKFARRNKTALAMAACVFLALAGIVGGVGWAVRDRSAREEEAARELAAREQQAARERRDRQQRLTAQVELILGDVEQLERAQKWPEAQAAAERAEVALAGGEADDAVRGRVGEARRDLAFIARLGRIRQDLAVTVEGKFNYGRAVRDYAQAFREYGMDVERLPAEAALAALRGRPALAIPVASALDSWVDARRGLGGAEPNWRALVALACELDPDPLRDRLRGTWGRPITPELQDELRQLAASVDLKVQSPETILALANTLVRGRLPDVALGILREGQHAYPGDFFLNLNLAGVLHYRKDHAEVVRYSTAAVSIQPKSAAAHHGLGIALREQKKLDEAVAECRKAIQLDPQYASAHISLGAALKEQGKLDEGIAECRKAIELDPKLANAHNNLGNGLKRQGKLEQAVAEYRKAIELDPKCAMAHYNLGVALSGKGDLNGAVAEYRKAIELDPKLANAHDNLGCALSDMGYLDGAIQEYREAIRLEPDHPRAHLNLGNALCGKGDLNAAIAEYRKAIALKPDFALAHCNLGGALKRKGEFHAALHEYQRGHELGLKDPSWRYPSAEWVRQCERLVELDGKLPGFLARKAPPASSRERIELAELCAFKRLSHAAVRFYEEAFTAEPKLADDLGAAHRYNAACAAALAGCGKGKDADKLDEKEKARLRKQALGWLRADLLLRHKQRASGKPAERAEVQAKMRWWLGDSDFAGVRDPGALAKLPEAERQPWQQLWSDVAALLKRPQGKPAPKKK